MGAIKEHYSSSEAAIKAFLAGSDLLLMPENFIEAYQGMLDAINKDIISEDRVDESLRRIIHIKLKMKLNQ